MSYQNIIPSIKLGSDYSLTYFKGSEILTDGNRINSFRKVPDFISKFNLYAEIVKNFWIKIDNIICDDWYSRQISSTTREESDVNYENSYYNPKNKIDSYYLLDIILEYRKLTPSGKINLYLKFYNALNTGYGGIGAYGSNDLIYNPQYGRRIMLGCSFSY
jgi:hypothetical protein